MPANAPIIIQQSAYDDKVHAGYTRYGQILTKTVPSGASIDYVHWIFYSDIKPAFCAPLDWIIEIPDLNIREGFQYNPVDKTFYDLVTNWRDMYTDAQLLHRVRLERNKKLSDTDFLVLRYRDQLDLGTTPDITTEDYMQLLEYRQKLRDLPVGCRIREFNWPDIPKAIS